jgi:hypothetical protein
MEYYWAIDFIMTAANYINSIIITIILTILIYISKLKKISKNINSYYIISVFDV